VRAAVAALGIVLGVAAPAAAQDRVLATYRVDAWDVADLAWARSPAGQPLRVLVHGTLSSSIDGSEIDALELHSGGRVVEGAPVAFPPGTRLVERRGPHRYLFEVPPGGTIGLNTFFLASRVLATASEYRASVSGAIVVELLEPAGAAPAASPGPIAAAAPSPFALAGTALGLPLLAFGLFVYARRRISREDELLRRVRRARTAILREARALGPAFDGALASAEALCEAARKQRDHVTAIERAITRTAWVRAEPASLGQASLRVRRDEAAAKLHSIVSRLEETVVRMASCVADRSAIPDLERDLSAMRSEVEVGESVEQEIAALADRGGRPS
jgi:hypothetical protein